MTAETLGFNREGKGGFLVKKSMKVRTMPLVGRCLGNLCTAEQLEDSHLPHERELSSHLC